MTKTQSQGGSSFNLWVSQPNSKHISVEVTRNQYYESLLGSLICWQRMKSKPFSLYGPQNNICQSHHKLIKAETHQVNEMSPIH